MRLCSILAVLAFLSVSIAHASQAELQEAYAAYQEAAATGDVRAALLHAERAYELGLELYGNSDMRAAEHGLIYGTSLNDINDHAEAARVLADALDIASTSGDSETGAVFPYLIELGKAELHVHERNTARAETRFQHALEIAEIHFGPNSREVATALMYLAYLPARSTTFAHSDSDRYRVTIGVIYGNRNTVAAQGLIASLESTMAIERAQAEYRTQLAATFLDDEMIRADEILWGLPDTTYERAFLAAIGARYAHLRGQANAAESNRNLSMSLVHEAGFVEDELIQLLLGSMADYPLVSGFNIGDRREGEIIPLRLRTPSYPERPASRNIEGWVEVEFWVRADGDVEHAEVSRANPARWFDDESEEAVRRWRFLPRVESGKPVRSGPYLVTIQFDRHDRLFRADGRDIPEYLRDHENDN